jgi:hypothetical protein
MVKADFVLGLLGGIFGFFAGLLALGFGGLGEALGASSATSIIGLGALAILASIIGIVGAAISGGRPKAGGGLMIISGILGLIAVSMFYLLSTVLLVVGGIMALRSKKAKK